MKYLNRAALPAVLLVVGLIGQPVLAQSEPQDAQETTGTITGEPTELTKKEKKQQAKEARIAEYLRKKEEKRARRELAAESSAEAAAAAAPTAVDAPVEVAENPRQARPNRRLQRQRSAQLPRGLARAQQNVRKSILGSDPTVTPWLDKIDRQEASPLMLAEFGNFLAENGMIQDAMEYYAVALNLEPDDPNLWVNMGILHSKRGDVTTAAKAFENALEIDQNNARGHYNLGAAYDQMDKYEEAIQEYKRALTLDPSLGDPTVNPQAANNKRLLAVKLMLYREQQGSLGLPLVAPPESSDTPPQP